MHSALLAVSSDSAAPSWVPMMAFAIPALIVLAVTIPAFRSRHRSASAKHAQSSGRKESDTALGSAESIEDGGAYSSDALLKALAVKPEDHGPVGDLPHDEGWAGTMLGLKSKMSSATELLEPHFHWGSRAAGQVFIRIGPDEKIAGGTELYSNRHVRQITVLRVAAPQFTLGEQGGRPITTDGATPELEGILSTITPNSGVWTGMYAHAGNEGIVISRGALTAPQFWAYDLWLAERIARKLGLAPLPDQRIGPAWKVPYDLGRSLRAATGDC